MRNFLPQIFVWVKVYITVGVAVLSLHKTDRILGSCVLCFSHSENYCPRRYSTWCSRIDLHLVALSLLPIQRMHACSLRLSPLLHYYQNVPVSAGLIMTSVPSFCENPMENLRHDLSIHQSFRSSANGPCIRRSNEMGPSDRYVSYGRGQAGSCSKTFDRSARRKCVPSGKECDLTQLVSVV